MTRGPFFKAAVCPIKSEFPQCSQIRIAVMRFRCFMGLCGNSLISYSYFFANPNSQKSFENTHSPNPDLWALREFGFLWDRPQVDRWKTGGNVSLVKFLFKFTNKIGNVTGEKPVNHWWNSFTAHGLTVGASVRWIPPIPHTIVLSKLPLQRRRMIREPTAKEARLLF